MDKLTCTPAPFELLYARYGPRVMAYAFGRLRDRHAAEDVLQEAFSRLHQKLQRDGPTNGGTAEFLFGVARSRIIDRIRRRGTRPTQVPLADAPEPALAGPTRMDGPTEQAEVHRLINRALLALRYVAGFNASELATAIGLSPPGTRARLQRLLARLRTELE